MMVRNIRRSMVEYHDILWDIGCKFVSQCKIIRATFSLHLIKLFFVIRTYVKIDAKTWEEASINLMNLYSNQAPIEDFFVWRDERVMEEVHWYG